MADNKFDMSLFKTIADAVSYSGDLDVTAEHLCRLLLCALGIKGVTIFIYNPDTKELEILDSAGLSMHYLNKGPVFIDKSLGRDEIVNARLIADVEGSTALQYPDDAKKEGVKAILSLPIKLSNNIIGCLRLYHFEVWDLSSKDLEGLKALADMVGLALMYSRLKTIVNGVSEIVGDVHPFWLQ